MIWKPGRKNIIQSVRFSGSSSYSLWNPSIHTDRQTDIDIDIGIPIISLQHLDSTVSTHIDPNFLYNFTH